MKKHWRNVYSRAAHALPQELPVSPAEDVDVKRGKEKKRHLLEYLRSHMEELRPVLPRGAADESSKLRLLYGSRVSGSCPHASLPVTRHQELSATGHETLSVSTRCSAQAFATWLP